MQWLLLSFSLFFSYMPQNEQMVNSQFFNQPCFVQTIDISGLVAEHLNVYGSVRTYDFHNKDLSFLPFRADYSIGAELLWRGFSLGIKHECDHPVVYDMGAQQLGYGGNETEIYLSFKGQWQIF